MSTQHLAKDYPRCDHELFDSLYKLFTCNKTVDVTITATGHGERYVNRHLRYEARDSCIKGSRRICFEELCEALRVLLAANIVQVILLSRTYGSWRVEGIQVWSKLSRPYFGCIDAGFRKHIAMFSVSILLFDIYKTYTLSHNSKVQT